MGKYLERQRNTLRVEPLLIIALIGLIVGGGLLYVSKGFKVTPNSIYVAESSYKAALIVADGYVQACSTGKIPPSCVSTMRTIKADVLKTQVAYEAIKGLEANPPQTAGEDFIAAVSVLKGVVAAVQK